MTIVAGTLDGAYRVSTEDGTAERTTDATVYRVHEGPDGGVLAGTDDGVLRSADGREWTRRGDLRAGVRAVLTTDDAWYAGADGPAVYRSADSGDTWTACAELDDLGDRDRSPGDDAVVRTLATVDGTLLAGIEADGVVASPDGGDTWRDRSDGIHDDLHHLLVDDGAVLAACGNGCYRSTDAGRSWRRLDVDFRDFWFNYHREAALHDGAYHLGANGWGPEAPGGRLIELPVDAADGRDSAVVDYPGEDESFPVGWTRVDGTLYAGTMDVTDGFGQHDPGWILRRGDDGWERAVEVPAAPRSLAALGARGE
jgi:hypothetical protein